MIFPKPSTVLIIWMRPKTIMKLVALLVNGNWVDLRTVVMPLFSVPYVELILNGERNLWNIAGHILTSKSQDFLSHLIEFSFSVILARQTIAAGGVARDI